MDQERLQSQINELPEEVERFNIHYRIQHIILFTTFIIVALTGWSLKYPEVEYSSWWIKIWGGPETAGIIHRVAGITMLLDFVYHLIYIGYRFSKGNLSFDIVPAPKDFVDFFQNIKYFLGISSQKPKFGRFTYTQKFDYWAVFWGIFIIGTSGLALAFPTKTAILIPSWASNWVWELLYVMHSDEALLAIVFIFFWHFYNEHLKPEV
ncbi:MAG: cytochrome b/b6 domain-containing protein, partial [Nitrospirota bacterium]